MAGAGVASWARLYAYSSEFWDKKDPSEWTSDEIDRLTTKSPWAKEAAAQLSGGADGGYGGGGQTGQGGGYPGGGTGGVGMPRIGIGGIGIGMPRNRGGMGGGQNPGNGRGAATTYRGTVRWESAQPIRTR